MRLVRCLIGVSHGEIHEKMGMSRGHEFQSRDVLVSEKKAQRPGQAGPVGPL